MIRKSDTGTLASIGEDLQAVEENLLRFIGHSDAEVARLAMPILRAGGKRMRTQLYLQIAHPAESLEKATLGAVIELIHTASLIHDDIIDNTPLRRGTPTINSVYSNKMAVLSGDYLFAKAFAETAQLKKGSAYLSVLSKVLLSLSEGEFLQMQDLYNVRQGEERYLLKTQRKTADFIEACIELGAITVELTKPVQKQLANYGHALGMLFQIVDDILDYCGTVHETGKPIGQDLAEGVITLPALYVLESEKGAEMAALIERIKGGNSAEEAVRFVIAHGGIAYAEERCRFYREQAHKALEGLEDYEFHTYLKECIILAERRRA